VAGLSDAAREQRLRRIADFLAAGMSLLDIAHVLKLHPNAIRKAVVKIKDQAVDRAKNAKSDEELGKHFQFLTSVEEKAMSEYHACGDKPNVRANFLQLALRARGMTIELQQQAGILPKAADKVEVEQLFKTSEGADIREMSMAELEALEQATVVELRSVKGKKDDEDEDEDEDKQPAPSVNAAA
jgi:hypothetical protein